MSERTREGLGAFAAPSAPPAPPAEEPALPVPPPLPDPPPDEEDDDGTAIVPVPESESGWYWVYTPNRTFVGSRMGKDFVANSPGETVVHANELVVSSVPGGKHRRTRLVDLMVRDLGYRAEPVPPGVPPVPHGTLVAAGISAGVANS